MLARLTLLLPLLCRLPSDAPPLPPPSGRIVRVSSAEALLREAARISPGTTILLEKGTYKLPATIYIPGPVQRISIRGATGNPKDVVIAGRGMANRNYGNVPHGLLLGAVKNALIANLTIRDVYFHCIQLQGERGLSDVRIYNCRLLNAGEQIIKGSITADGRGVQRVVVEYCLIGFEKTARGDYTDGVDLLGARDCIIRHNKFVNIRAPAGKLAGPAVLMWRGSADTICEANVFINCQRGIHFGMVPGPKPDHRGGIIRNNFFVRTPSQPGDVGIAAWNSPGTKILHNTVILSGTYPNAIECRYSTSTGVVIAANLCDAAIAARDGAKPQMRNNFTSARSDWFADPAAGDLHLRPGIRSRLLVPLAADCPVDFDGQQRANPTPAGADD